MLNQYIYKNNRKLRCGFTTGSCAAAAAKAAASILLSGTEIKEVSITTPKGILLSLPIERMERQKEAVSCAIRKDSGDDADVTNGILVYASVSRTKREFLVEGGIGIGRVTRPGLEQPVGAAAINRVPRQMILEALQEAAEEAGYEGGLSAVISIPEGIEIAKKTFNPRLGIEGGISVLGTSGIVEPMSERALLETIHAEMKQQAAEGRKYLIITPGNYGSDFIRDVLHINLEHCMKCSNFIGETIDMAYEFKLEGLLLVGHIGKLVKLGAGVMNTHSKWADARMETLCAAALRAGCDLETTKKILACNTTEEAVTLLEEKGMLKETMNELSGKMEEHLTRRAFQGLHIGAIFFSNEQGILGHTSKAADLLELCRKEIK
ncbi:MAG: cobalt-precorrin-5B (C(1))-methyltransferase CbiD [Lachnospiraceae bacterium]|nr:cobalt-precorrin-5B (C(1))-methyltransferase CbiD [Lachnospiraceae bacterium]MCM1279459.1 cobalt-precorrin-5B (C(1))-methyltransferase CbiD [Robinsoniella sp.]